MTPKAIGSAIDRTISSRGITQWSRIEGPVYSQNNEISEMTHGDDFVATGATLKNKLAGVCPINAKVISHESTDRKNESREQKSSLGKGVVLYTHDPRHVDVLVKAVGLGNANTVQTLAADDALSENAEPLKQEQFNHMQIPCCQVLVPQSRSS